MPLTPFRLNAANRISVAKRNESMAALLFKMHAKNSFAYIYLLVHIHLCLYDLIVNKSVFMSLDLAPLCHYLVVVNLYCGKLSGSLFTHTYRSNIYISKFSDDDDREIRVASSRCRVKYSRLRNENENDVVCAMCLAYTFQIHYTVNGIF